MGWLWWVGVSEAQTAPGQVERIAVTPDVETFLNVTLTGVGGALWFAEERIPDKGDPSASPPIPPSDDPELDVSRFNGTQWTRATVQGAGCTICPDNSLKNSGMYPSVATWPNSPNLVLVGKENHNTTNGWPHLVAYAVNRTTLVTTPSNGEPVMSNTELYEHSKPMLGVRSPVTPDQHVCWTRKTNALTSDDTMSKFKDGATWLTSALHSVPTFPSATLVEEHCALAFFGGTRYLANARRAPVGSPTTDWDPDVFVQLATSVPWAQSDFPLNGSAGANFPSIWVSAVPGGSQVFVTAECFDATANTASHGGCVNPQDLLYWTCGPAATTAGCDSSAEFGNPVVVTSNSAGGNEVDAKVFDLPHGAAHDTFIVHQKTTANGPVVRLFAKCAAGAGAGVWTLKGKLPLPPTQSCVGTPPNDTCAQRFSGDQHLGVFLSSSNPQVYWDGTYVHLAFLADQLRSFSGDKGTFEVLHYWATPSQLCP